jgi:hypothetical protein
MKMKCLACGELKDTRVPEPYPYPDDNIVCDRPIDPLWVLDCQGPPLQPGDTTFDWRVVIVCHHCLHRLEPDMWISNAGWNSLDPAMPFDRLPHPLPERNPLWRSGGASEVERYAQHL